MTVDALSVLTPRLPVDISVNSKAMSDSLVFFFKKNIDLLTSFWLHGAFVAALGLSLVVGGRGYSSCSTQASHFGGFSLQSIPGSSARAQQLWHMWAWLPRGLWDLPRPGIAPVSRALAGGFLTTGPPEQSLLGTL